MATLGGVLDARLHRAALLVLVVPAIIFAAFSLRPGPQLRTGALAPDAFDVTAALADLKSLSAIPDHRPGSPGDFRSAQFVASRLTQAGFRVSQRRYGAQTTNGHQQVTTIVATRTGFSPRKVVLAADRAGDLRTDAGLSATATLLETARVLGGRTLAHTVEIVSTGAGPGGGLTGYESLDATQVATLILGDVGGGPLARPFVTPWGEGRGVAAPLALERSVAGAVKEETGLSPGGSGSITRISRLMLPLTAGGQGEIVANGLPAVQLSSRGEQRVPNAPVDSGLLDSFGRAALRTAGILDGAPADWPGRSNAEIPIRDRVLPDWASRLLGAAGILLALAVGVDGMARARRRGIAVVRPALWVLSAWPAFLLAWLVILFGGAVGLLGDLPASTAPVGVVSIRWAVPVLVAIALVIGWVFIRRRLAVSLSQAGDPGPGVASAVALLGASVAALVWIGNPLTAILIVPFINIAPWLCDSDRLPRRRARAVLFGATVLPLLCVAPVLAVALGAGPVQFSWMLMLALADGTVGVIGGLVMALGLAIGASVFVLVMRKSEDSGSVLTTRGPVTYAGPGSLGGTESAFSRR